MNFKFYFVLILTFLRIEGLPTTARLNLNDAGENVTYINLTTSVNDTIHIDANQTSWSMNALTDLLNSSVPQYGCNSTSHREDRPCSRYSSESCSIEACMLIFLTAVLITIVVFEKGIVYFFDKLYWDLFGLYYWKVHIKYFSIERFPSTSTGYRPPVEIDLTFKEPVKSVNTFWSELDF